MATTAASGTALGCVNAVVLASASNDLECSDKVGHFRFPGRLESMNQFLLFAIGVRHSLVLAQMFNPRVKLESLKEPALSRYILENFPFERSVPPPLPGQPLESREKRAAIYRPDPILDGHSTGPPSASTSLVRTGTGQCMEGVRSRCAPVWSFQRHSSGTAINAPMLARM
jgi:hypothetical protein